MLDPELRLEADFNPLISPPPELLKGGLLQVQEYLRVRMVRQRELCDLVTELDFEYIMERTHPGTFIHTHPINTHTSLAHTISTYCPVNAKYFYTPSFTFFFYHSLPSGLRCVGRWSRFLVSV